MAKLFLSYSRTDAQKAQRLADWLQREGHEVWRDENDIGGGASFSSEIEKALKDCDAVLALWSAASVRSAWVRDEAAYGRDAGKLLPISLDGTGPPLGFREFQSVELSGWKAKGQPPAAERIRRAIARISGSSGAIQPSVSAPIAARRVPDRSTFIAIAAAGILSLALVAGLFVWRASRAEQELTIAISASPTSSDAATAADYANVAAADLASYLPSRFQGATIIAPAEVDSHTRGYRLEIATGRHGKGADASLTLTDQDGRSILWSKSWSVPDASAADLGQQISQAASQASLCLANARGRAKRIDQPALGIYISGCAGLFDPNVSMEQLRAIYYRLVKLAPDFPKAWAGVAMVRAIDAEELQNRNGVPDQNAIRSAREAIATARKLDPHSAFPYLAEWHLVGNDQLRGLALLDKAVEVDPDEPLVYARLSNSLMSVGRMRDAVEAAHRAVELEPIWSFTRESYINALSYAGQFSRAEAEIAESRQKWPNNSEIETADFNYHYRYGDARRAEELLPRVISASDAQLAPYRKVIAARLNPTPANVDEAIAAVTPAKASDKRRRGDYLLSLAEFGRSEEVYRLLAGPQLQQSITPDLLFRPEFAGVRAEPRFIDVAARLGLVRYWRQSGHWPDFCDSEKLRYDCREEAEKYR